MFLLCSSFVILNALDFFLTWCLIEKWGIATESNPIASSILDAAGWPGLCGFKFLFTIIPLAAFLGISSRSPRLAARLAIAGVIVLSAVVGYSTWNLIESTQASDMLATTKSSLERSNQLAESRRLYLARLNLLAQKMADKKQSLAETVDKLSRSSHNYHKFRANLIRFGIETHNPQPYTPRLSLAQYLAIDAIRTVIKPIRDERSLVQLHLDNLGAQYQQLYGSELPAAAFW